MHLSTDLKVGLPQNWQMGFSILEIVFIQFSQRNLSSNFEQITHLGEKKISRNAFKNLFITNRNGYFYQLSVVTLF